MAITVTSTVNTAVKVTNALLKFLYGYIERFFTVNIPKNYVWLKNTYYPSAKRIVNHPKFNLIANLDLRNLVKSFIAGIAVGVGIGLVVVLWGWCFLRSFSK